MGIDTAIEYADQLLYERTGRHLSDLQSCIIQQSWQGRTYGQVAAIAGYSEGHIKDVASQLWRLLSEALGERITKGNLRSRLINRVKRTLKKASPLHQTESSALAEPAIALPAAIPTPFIGREQALDTLQTLALTHRAIVIQGEGGIGKTTLAQQYCQRFDQTLELLMAKESASITPVESVVEEWLRQRFDEEPGREFGVTLSRLKHHLQQGSVAVLIDNLEPALDSNGQFIAAHRHYVELLRVLCSAGATTIITSRDRLCEPGVNVYHYRLPGLSLESWQQFFQDRQTSKLESLAQMHSAYGGNAKAMEILCAAALEDFEGDVSAYWQENNADLLGASDLRNLVVSQVNRLQALDESAYRVFCRLGCYRYQDRAKLKAAAVLALMWDIDPLERRQTLNSLRDRSLLEFRKGDYWLHPVSRAEAILRLRQGSASSGSYRNVAGDWQQANRAAADYWTNSVSAVVSVEDGLQALEAYYHLIAAEDYDAAAAVLLKSRHNQWQQFLPLAASLYRVGLLQPVVSAIGQVLPHVSMGRSELNNILGDVYWITGKIHEAIACQQQTLADTERRLSQLKRQPVDAQSVVRTDSDEILEQQVDSSRYKRDIYYLKMLTVDAHLSMGLYRMDLWELSAAAEQFEQVIALAAGSDHQAWADKATVGLALASAYSGQTAMATELALEVYPRFTTGENDRHGRHAYFLQLLGQVFDSLGAFDKAQALYAQVIDFAETGHYVQVQAKALTGMAVLQRHQAHYEKAICLHEEAVVLCEKIGAKCDLAEAYFQLGLSRRLAAMAERGDVNCSEQGGLERDGLKRDGLEQGSFAQDYFAQAIALFSDIRAPQQVARVAAAKNVRDTNAAAM